MFGLDRPHRGAIDLGVLDDLPKDAQEIARFWVTSERSLVAVGHQASWSPELLGSLLIECVHTAAASYSASGAMSEAEALQRIWQGLDDERQRLVQTGN